MKKAFHVTLADIARKLDVSTVTVSKALRGHPDISEETVRKIKKLAREMGYTPNRIASSLSSRKSNTIGVIIPKVAHFFFSSVIEAIYDAAFETGYEIILTVSQENAAREARHLRSLLSMRVDGIIVSVTEQTKDPSVFADVKATGVPLTFMDRVLDMDGYSKIVVDDRGGAFAATEQAIKAGYRRIAHLGGYQHTSIGRERYRGFSEAMALHGIPINPHWVVFGGFSEDQGYNGFMQIYSGAEKPEFVFAATFPISLGVYRAAERLHLRIPEDIDIIGFGNSGFNQVLSPPLTYVDQPTRDLGRKSLEVCLDHIRRGPRFQPTTIVLPTHLILARTGLGPNAAKP
ncbi:MAG: transcriptional regulator, LacI family [Bacteroidetes bacterium]|nr:transcriptional regulator, LacI family [Bacteroidota bacterium]